MTTTLLTIVLAIVPPDEELHKGLAVAKVIGSTLLLVGGGIAVFWMRTRSRRLEEDAGSRKT